MHLFTRLSSAEGINYILILVSNLAWSFNLREYTTERTESIFITYFVFLLIFNPDFSTI